MKPFPYSTTKKKLLEMYGNQMSDRDIKESINEIIRQKRNIPDNAPTPKKQKIWHIELKAFVLEFGLPKGYELPEWIKDIDVNT